MVREVTIKTKRFSTTTPRPGHCGFYYYYIVGGSDTIIKCFRITHVLCKCTTAAVENNIKIKYFD